MSALSKILVAVGAGALLALPPIVATPATSAPVDPDVTLREMVTAQVLDRARDDRALAGATAGDTRVTVSRRAGDWAFGTAVVVAPRFRGAFPHGDLFLGQWDGRSWRLAFHGDSGFAGLAAAAPLVSAEERELFAPVAPLAYGDYRTGMRLPFGVGQTWYMGGGPHGWSGYNTPWSSIDLSGGDQVVVAARGGTAYTMCRGWLRVIHDRGYATDYYHLWSNINVNGAPVGEGAFLGYTGTDVTCGGSANGRHVHFALRQNNAYVGIAGHNFGKWVPMNGGAAYQGYALHGSTRVNVGGGLYNYGALGFNQGIIDANGGGYVNKRSGPGTGYAVVGTVNDGTTVTVSCSANGTTHTGRWGTTALWNRLSDGTWVTDAFMWTGLDGPINGWC
ncbi:MAG TPA: peptidase M23 [Micromonosporaceae bacterium]|nr:peptidase M23 [Micromonosporaceae bacterium]